MFHITCFLFHIAFFTQYVKGKKNSSCPPAVGVFTWAYVFWDDCKLLRKAFFGKRSNKKDSLPKQTNSPRFELEHRYLSTSWVLEWVNCCELRNPEMFHMAFLPLRIFEVTETGEEVDITGSTSAGLAGRVENPNKPLCQVQENFKSKLVRKGRICCLMREELCSERGPSMDVRPPTDSVNLPTTPTSPMSVEGSGSKAQGAYFAIGASFQFFFSPSVGKQNNSLGLHY